MRDLKCSQQTVAEHFVSREACNCCIVKIDFACIWLERTRDDIEEGGFTSTVGSDESANGAGFKVQAKIVDRGESTETLGYACNTENR